MPDLGSVVVVEIGFELGLFCRRAKGRFVFIIVYHNWAYAPFSVQEIGFVLHKKVNSFQTLTATADFTDFY
jgi:hypothetical protein